MPPVFTAAGRAFNEAGAACAASIQRTFAAHLPFYACCLLFCGLTLAITAAWHVPLSFASSLSFLALMPKFLAMGIGLAALIELARLFRQRCPRPLPALGRWLYARVFAEDRPGNVFHSLVTFTPLMIAFSALKEQIPAIHSFAWDRTFMQWDRALGFGHLPWKILQPALGYPIVTAGINFVYDLWFFAMFGALLWQAFQPRGSILRTQFLIAFAFAWFIAGNVLAVILSSAGPCFYGHFFAADPYAAQMHYLRAADADWPIWSVNVQDLLWQSYVTRHGAFVGISAMPSMHVTSMVLIALLCARTNRRLGTAAWIFTALIVLGSIHLAWHYAVDSLAGIALAIVFWQIAGQIARAEARYRGAFREAGEAAAA